MDNTSTRQIDWGMLIEEQLPDPLAVFSDLPIGDNGERWQLDQSPWVGVVLDWWLDPSVEWIYLIQGSQTSKTTTQMGLMLFAGKHDPGPAMWVGAIEEEVDKFVVQRLKPFLEAASPQVRTSKKVDWRKADLRLFGRMLIHFAWATSGKKLRSWPCRYIFGDEVGIWPASVPECGDPLEYVKKRTRRYRGRRKGIFGTTPSSDLHPAWIAAKNANFARWFVPCPECGHSQFLDFSRGIKFGHCRKRGEEWSLSRVRSESYFECEACGGTTEADKSQMIQAGRVEYIDPDTGAAREFDPGNTSRTLQIPASYSMFTTWGELAANFIDAKHKGSETLRIFVTDELAQPWREKTESPDADAISKCVDHERAPGTMPEAAFALTSFADVQKDRVYYVVRAWGLHMRSWLIQYGMIRRPQDTRLLDFLDEVLLRDYDGWPINRGFVDSGFDTDLVYAYCRRVGSRRFSPSKGSNSPTAEPVKGAPVERHGGRPVPAGLILFNLNSHTWKSFVHDHVKTTAGDPGEWRLHAETDGNFMRQILSEARVERERAGQVTREWVLIDRSAGNHYLDCEAGAAAAAWDLGIQRMRQRPVGAGPRVRTETSEQPKPKPADPRRNAWAIRPLSEHV